MRAEAVWAALATLAALADGPTKLTGQQRDRGSKILEIKQRLFIDRVTFF